jgi:hypothetical protein
MVYIYKYVCGGLRWGRGKLSRNGKLEFVEKEIVRKRGIEKRREEK